MSGAPGEPSATPSAVHLLAGPGLAVDPELLEAIARAEFAALGVPGAVAHPADLAGALARATADPDATVVVLPGPDPAARAALIADRPGAGRIVWYEPDNTGPVEVAGGAGYQWGRGVWGVVWAIRHAVYRLRHPARRVGYGPHPDQWIELRMPTASRNPVPGALPVPGVLLVHGGYWRSMWGTDLLDALAIDLAARGYAAGNLEYRRPDRHGWAATVADVAAGLAALAGVPGVDPGRIGVLGHSAGGQLALRAAADAGTAAPAGPMAPGVVLAGSLAGVLDLAQGYRRNLSNGAVAAALGGRPDEIPERYAAADPMARLPLRVPQLVVQGGDDDPDLVDIARRYARAALAAGDDVHHLELPGDHFAVIDPGSPIWRATAEALATRLPAFYNL